MVIRHIITIVCVIAIITFTIIIFFIRTPTYNYDQVSTVYEQLQLPAVRRQTPSLAYETKMH